MLKNQKNYTFDHKNLLALSIFSKLTGKQSEEYLNFIITEFEAEKKSYQFYLNEILVLLQLNYKNLHEDTVTRIMQFYTDIHFEFVFKHDPIERDTNNTEENKD